METLLTYDDIIFLRKNKAYGAYIIRKDYKRNVGLSVIITLIFFTLTLSAPLLLKHSESINRVPRNGVGVILENIPITEKVKAEDIVIPLKPLKSTIAFKVPKVVEDEKAIIDNLPTIQEMLDKLPSSQTVEGSKDGIEIITEIPNTIVIEENKEEVQREFTWVEEMPQYSKGEDALLEFISKTVVYPEIAKRAGIEGKVYLTFIIEKDGSISDIALLKGIGAGCDEEAIKALKLMDKWIPGKQNGNPVRVRINFPITFKLGVG